MSDRIAPLDRIAPMTPTEISALSNDELNVAIAKARGYTSENKGKVWFLKSPNGQSVLWGEPRRSELAHAYTEGELWTKYQIQYSDTLSACVPLLDELATALELLEIISVNGEMEFWLGDWDFCPIKVKGIPSVAMSRGISESFLNWKQSLPTPNAPNEQTS